MSENVCRICFESHDTLLSLHQKRNGVSPYYKLVNKLKVEISDSGSSFICLQCAGDLDISVNFLDKCWKSNELLASKNSIENCRTSDTPNDLIERDNACSVTRSENISDSKVIQVRKVRAEEELEVKSPQCPECGSFRRCKHWAPPASHTCQYCHKVFTRKFNFTIHVKRHLDQNDWSCPVCGAVQLTQWLARRHCRPRARRPCPVPGCDKSFTSNTNLQTHVRSHNGERPHVCSECGKSFTSKNTLKDHLRIHTGVKPYICPVCGKQFATNKLAAHLLTHSDARPHACPVPSCSRAFRSAGAARLHARTHAAAARAHACPRCAARYNHSQSLNKHMRKHHQLLLSLTTVDNQHDAADVSTSVKCNNIT